MNIPPRIISGCVGLGLLFVVSCNLGDEAPTAVSAYPIYAALLEDIADSTWATPILVRRSTGMAPGFIGQVFDSASADFLQREIPRMSATLVEAARRANDASRVLADSLPPSSQFRFADKLQEAVLDSLPGLAFVRLRAELGDHVAVVQVSQPGVSQDGNEALVYYNFTCDAAMCSQGDYAYLQRLSGGWVVVARVVAWIT